MGGMRAYLFGQFQAELGEERGAISLQPHLKQLLAFLLIYRDRSHKRETVAGILWPESGREQARRCLNSALCRLRRRLGALKNETPEFLMTPAADEIRFDTSNGFWLDIAEFEDSIERVIVQSQPGCREQDLAALDYAVGLYRGDALEGIYEEWALRERERLQSLLVVALQSLMDGCGELGRFEHAALHGRRLLTIDPLREDIHRELMRIYLAVGDRARALRQYRDLHELLHLELNVAPMPETAELYDQIRGGDRVDRQYAEPGSAAANLKSQCKRVRQRLSLLKKASRHFETSVVDIEEMIVDIERSQTKALRDS